MIVRFSVKHESGTQSQADLPLDKFVERLHEVIRNGPADRTIHTSIRLTFRDLLAISPYETIVECEPRVEAYTIGSRVWLVVGFHLTKEHAMGRVIWKCARRGAVVPSSPFYEILEGGVVWTQTAEGTQRYDPNHPDWPTMTINPVAYEARQMIKKLLHVHDDSNPLTGIIRGGGQSKVFARQLADRLHEIRNLLDIALQ